MKRTTGRAEIFSLFDKKKLGSPVIDLLASVQRGIRSKKNERNVRALETCRLGWSLKFGFT